jgi:hypothetical protein
VIPTASSALLAIFLLAGCSTRAVHAPAAFPVDADVALSSLIALADGQLQQIGDHLHMLARTEEGSSADWERLRGPLGAVERLERLALLWFALPDGTYWSVQEGPADGNLSDRPYWPGLMGGETVMGDLVVSRATGRSSAIVAVPVRDHRGTVIGALGASVFLDSLSHRIRGEMNLAPHYVFYSLDPTPVVGLHIDPETIFVYPLEEEDPQLQAAILEMLGRQEGVVTYSFRGSRRTILYRRSPVTGWWYGFGFLE